MSTEDEDERTLADELERRTPTADAAWSSRLGTELERERLRRGVAPRPSHLWLRVLAAGALGAVLLVLALTQV